MMYSSKIIIIVAILFSSSCLKQEAPDVGADYDGVVSDSQRLNSCTNINFNKGFLRKNNIRDLFLCTRWASKFPTLFSSIEKIPDQSWDRIMAPFDKVFFDDEERRDRMIRILRELDSQSALDGLGEVLTSLNETNFYDAFYELLVCAEEPENTICDKRTVSLNKEEVKVLLRGVNRSPRFYENLQTFFSYFVKALKPNKDTFKREVQKFYDQSAFQKSRLYLANRVFEDFAQGLEVQRVRQWQGLLSGGAAREGHFLWDWLNAPYMNRDKFHFLMTYPILERPELIKEHKVVESAIDQGMICRPTSNNNYLMIDIKKELESLMKGLRRGDQSDFMYYLSQKSLLLRSAETFCHDVRNYAANIELQRRDGYVYQEEHRVDFLEQLEETTSLMADPAYYDLLKFLEINSDYFQKDTDEGHVLLDIITRPHSQQFIKMNEEILNNSGLYFKELFLIAKELPPAAYKALEEILQELEDDSKFRAALIKLAQSWNFYTENEKNFLFTVLDEHMTENVDYYSLFVFYEQALKEFPELAIEVNELWFKDSLLEEEFYKSLKDFTRLMSGDDILKDFQVFFSREHIIEVIKVITRGEKLKTDHLADTQFLNDYTEDVHQRGYRLSLGEDTLTDTYQCIESVLNEEQSFHRLLISLPIPCREVSEENITIEYFSWMNQLGEMLNSYLGTNSYNETFFSRDGLFSPRMVGAGASLADSIDESLDENASGLVDDIAFHLFDKERIGLPDKYGYQNVFGEFIRSLWPLLSFDDEKSVYFRNMLLKKWSSIDNQRHFSFWDSLINIMNGYGHHLESFDGDTGVTFSKTRFRFPCHHFVNQNVGYRCPQTAEEILQELFVTFDILGSSYDSKTTPLGNILVAASPEYGQPIPLNSSNAKPYRLSLKETFELQADVTDKNLNVNNIRIPYQAVVDGRIRRELLTTMERIELVIRDVDFRYNYLGVQYLNPVSQGQNYNEDVEGRKKLMEKCIKIPILRCGKKMSDDQQRRAENALEAYDGLLDINNGRGLESTFRYGNYMKALLSAIVGSSAKEAQEVRLFPLGEDVLKKHNGLLLGSVTRMGFFTHLGRWIQSRFTSTSTDLGETLNSSAFKLIDRAILNGVSKKDLQRHAMKISQTLNSAEGKAFISDATRWLFDQSEKDLDVLEKGLGRLITIISHVGDDQTILGKNDPSLSHFDENSWNLILELMDLGIKNWEHVKTAFDGRFDLNEAIRETYKFLDYLYLMQERGGEDQRDLYIVVNELYHFINEVYASPLEAKAPYAFTNEEYYGRDYISTLLNQKEILRDFVGAGGEMISYIDALKYDQSDWNKGRWYRESAREAREVLMRSSGDFRAFKDYFRFTTLPQDCRGLESQMNCVSNPHYDEVFTLLGLLSQADDGGQGNFEKMTSKLFRERKSEIKQLLDEIFQVLTVVPDETRP